MCDSHTDDESCGFEIRQRSLDGGRPRGQLTLDGGVAVDDGGDDDCS